MKEIRPELESELLDLIQEANAKGAPLDLRGLGSKVAYGEVPAGTSLDLSAFSGIVDYAPEELVLTARAATPMTEIFEALGAAHQQLAFEPPDMGTLLGGGSQFGTLGGVVAAGLSGPRRVLAGAVRDHVLGVSGITGRGERFKSGGRVVKNVTGYDLSKLLTGSMGTLAGLTEITVKVLPRAEKARTLILGNVPLPVAPKLMARAAGSPYELSGLAWLPRALAARSTVPHVAEQISACVALRVEGTEASVSHRLAALQKLFAQVRPQTELHTSNSRIFWAEARDCTLFATPDLPLWRVCLPPIHAAKIAEKLPRAELLMDWAGGQVWVQADAAAAAILRGLIDMHGGHATLVRAPAESKMSVPVFQPWGLALTALHKRVKESFDPNHILGRSRTGIGAG